MINARSLLGKVRLHRPDLKDSVIDFYMQESIKKLCRQTMILQEEVSINIVADTNKYTLSKAGHEINRVHLVQLLLPDGTYKILGEANIVDINNKVSEQNLKGAPISWGFDLLKSELRIYPTLQKAESFKVKYSLIPKEEIVDIAIPAETEEAIVYGCLGEIYMLPGPAMNPSLAKNYVIQYNQEVSNVKSIAILGNSGVLTVAAHPLGGKRKNNVYNPYAW